MTKMSEVVKPRSDQMNADDLVSGPKQIKIRKVNIVGNPGDKQRVHVYYDGDDGKPWKPSVGMARIMIIGWGDESDNYVGKSMILYRDATVVYAGKEEGGIRISHMSDIQSKIHTMLTISRGKRIPFAVDVLQVCPGNPLPSDHLEIWSKNIENCQTMADLSEINKQVKERNYNEDGKSAIRKFYDAAVERIRTAEPK